MTRDLYKIPAAIPSFWKYQVGKKSWHIKERYFIQVSRQCYSAGALIGDTVNWNQQNKRKSNQIKCWFLRRGENRSTWRRTSQCRVGNQHSTHIYIYTWILGVQRRGRGLNTFVEHKLYKIKQARDTVATQSFMFSTQSSGYNDLN